MKKSGEGLYKEFYFLENDILYRSIMDNGHKFSTAVLPEDLTDTVLDLGHNQSGHNGYQRTYAAIKRNYYWKGNEETHSGSLENLRYMCKTKSSKNTIRKTNI